MENEKVVLTSNSSIGIGLGTSFCKYATSISGRTCKTFKLKQETIIRDLIKNMRKQISNKGPNYRPVDFDIWFNGPLNATLSVTLEQTDKCYTTRFDFESKNVGIGFWTATCKFFADIFGVSSSNYLDKMIMVTCEEKPNITHDKLVKQVIRKPSALNAVTMFLYCSEFEEKEIELEPTQNDTVPEIEREQQNTQIDEATLKTMEPVDKESLNVGDVVFIAHHEYNDYSKQSLNAGDKVVVKEIYEDSVLVQVDKQYYSFVAEVEISNLKK